MHTCRCSYKPPNVNVYAHYSDRQTRANDGCDACSEWMPSPTDSILLSSRFSIKAVAPCSKPEKHFVTSA